MHTKELQIGVMLWCLFLGVELLSCAFFDEASASQTDLSGHEYHDADVRGLTAPEMNSWRIAVLREIEEMDSQTLNGGYQNFGCFNITDEGIPLCRCDSSCFAFGDCCAEHLPLLSSQQLQQQKKHTCKCLFNGCSRRGVGVYKVGNCPESWRGSFVENLCLRKVAEESYTLILDIPVASSSTGIAYNNYYCAFCNGDKENLVNFTMKIDCFTNYLVSEFRPTPRKTFGADGVLAPVPLPATTTPNPDEKDPSIEEFLSRAKYIPGRRLFKWSTKWKTSDYCYLKIERYDDVDKLAETNHLRVCYLRLHKAIGTCDPSWQVDEDFKKCQSYSSPVHVSISDGFPFSTEAKIYTDYKNPHCAKCNFENFSLVDQIRPGLIHYYFRKDSSFHTSDVVNTFSLIFDLNKYCDAPDEAWRKVTGSCQKIFRSDRRSRLKSPITKVRSSHFGNGTNFNDTFDKCLRIALDDFVILKNGSVYSPRQDKLFAENEYEMDNGTALVCIEEDSGKFSTIHRYTTLVVLVISLCFLAFHVIFYGCFSRMRTWHGRNLLCLCCSLFLGQLLFLTGPQALGNHGVCVFLAICLHYFCLSSFFWMNVLSFDIWKTFKSHFHAGRENKGQIFIYYNLYSWGIPAAIVLAALLMDVLDASSLLSPRYGVGLKWRKLCWINSKLGLINFFLVPVGFIIGENLLLFIWTSLSIRKQSKEAQFANTNSQSVNRDRRKDSAISSSEDDKKKKKKNVKEDKARFTLYVKLGVIQGMAWVTWFVASINSSSALWYIFTVLNGLQGAAIFISFELQPWVLKLIWNRLKRISGLFEFCSVTMPTKKLRNKQERKDLSEWEQAEETNEVPRVHRYESYEEL